MQDLRNLKWGLLSFQNPQGHLVDFIEIEEQQLKFINGSLDDKLEYIHRQAGEVLSKLKEEGNGVVINVIAYIEPALMPFNHQLNSINYKLIQLNNLVYLLRYLAINTTPSEYEGAEEIKKYFSSLLKALDNINLDGRLENVLTEPVVIDNDIIEQ